ncbi:hypothetical protein HPB51_025182 [Rhipicephalus microplus]|uniref:THAP-type domain-containing protein n=1 Tax=Rhipicephalus microplus TaxID=6941 RepID=A0A9J6EDP6_RHIMP|nr:hypothetical protein HPB51_025182 [Rhipicephalus microplus]
MAYCCVPLCKSDEKKKPAGFSFHELPADADARACWLAAIRRDKWWPNTTSCYTKVCSRHFKEEDFIEGKRRRLNNRTVPSVFENYPPHLQPKSTAARNTASIDKRFLAHDIGPKGEVSSCYIKNLYDLQKDLVVKPVRYLSRKHVCPNNIEKTNVARAIQVFSPDVTAALEHLRDQAGHTSSVSFTAAGQTIVFMQNIHRCAYFTTGIPLPAPAIEGMVSSCGGPAPWDDKQCIGDALSANKGADTSKGKENTEPDDASVEDASSDCDNFEAEMASERVERDKAALEALVDRVNQHITACYLDQPAGSRLGKLY